MSVVFLGNDPGPVTRQKLNDMVAVWEAALEEAVGPRGWSPVFGVANDGDRRVFQIVDWVGGEGDKPTLTGYVGASGIVPTIGAGVDIRGPQGAKGDKGDTGSVGPKGDKGDTGNTGPKGDKGDTGNTGPKGDQGDAGWTPTLAVVSDGARRVHQVVDWTGGQGTKPATGQYVGASGLVSDIAQAVDIRGAAGDGIGNVNPTGDIEADDLAVFADGTGNLIKSGGRLAPSGLPNILPSLNLDFINCEGILDPRIVTVRSSEASYYDAAGVLRYAAANEPRIDYDPVTGECRGLLVEAQRTNLFTRSLHHAPLRVISRPSVAIAPDGTLTGMHMAATSEVGEHYSGDLNVSLVADTWYTYSTHVKSDGSGYKLYFRVASASVYSFPFDPAAPAVPPNTADRIAGYEDVGGGWHRVWMAFKAQASGSTVIRHQIANQFDTTSFAGDSASGFYVWGPQFEEGQFPTSYIPTRPQFSSRASTKTYFDASGVMRTASANEPAYDHGYVNGRWAPRGLSVEGAATNAVKHSSNFSNSVWNVVGLTSVQEGTTLVGGAAMWDLVESGEATFHRLMQTFSMQSNVKKVFSVYAAATEREYLRLSVDNGGASGVQAYFDLRAGAVAAYRITGEGASDLHAYLEPVGSGIFRCVVSAVISATDSGTIRVVVGGAESSTGNGSYQGVSSRLAARVFGAQLEDGGTATSYIPTEASAVTRAADVAPSSATTRAAERLSMSIADWYNKDEGTFIYRWQPMSPGHVFSIGQLSQNYGPRLTFAHDAANDRVRFIVFDDDLNVSATFFGPPMTDYSKPYTVAGGYKKNDFALSALGEILTDTSGNVPFNVNHIRFNPVPGENSSGWWKNLAHIPRRVPNAVLQRLTENYL